MLYTVYEHPWMAGGNEQWTYPATFMNGLTDGQKAFFNSCESACRTHVGN